MKAFEATVLELLYEAPQPLYSMYCVVADEDGDSVSMDSFFSGVDRMLDAGTVQLWQTYGDGQERRLAAVPADLEIYYSKVELDRSFDPFGFVLTLGPAAPAREEPAWQVDVDYKTRTVVVTGTSEAVPEDIGRALRLLHPHRFVELRRTQEGGRVRIEGVIVDDGEQEAGG